MKTLLLVKILLFSLLFLSCIPAFAQVKYGGKVTDKSGEPLIGATVSEKGVANGVIADENGNFEITSKSTDPVFIVSYIGYQSREVSAKDINGTVILEEGNLLKQVVVVGSRSLNRSATDTPAPVDVIDIKEVSSKTGQLDVNQLLQFAAPSFNSNRQTGSDGTDHVDPASLRGLGPDQTLVLINGKRRHQSSLVNIYGTRGRGNTGTDLNAIPVSAIERIEILRDGAAAQYGSDAIAGVINIVLKTVTNKLEVNANTGAYKAKYRFDDKEIDGLNYNFNGNYGIKVGKDGFVNLTADYNYRDHTNRANVDQSDLVRRQFGDPRAKNSAVFLNSKFGIGSKSQIYVFGGSNLRHGESYAWTRFAGDDRNVPEIYPDGFDPLIKAKIRDNSITAGFKTLLKDWELDISNSYGINQFDYHIDNTLNTSLGATSPTSFDAGGFSLSQNTVNLGITKFHKNIWAGLNTAFGLEYRKEQYKIHAGEEKSYKSYQEGLPAGSQGFPGFQPGDEVNKGRSNFGAYADVEADITRKFMVGVALRFENYSDFGSTLNGKIASRFKINDVISVRGTASTGFRAPSLPQIYFNSTVTNFIGGQAQQVLIARNNNIVTTTLGIPPLKQEISQNYSLGFTVRPAGNFSLTVDGYHIKVKDRIVLTGQFTSDDPDIGDLLSGLGVARAQFFTNAVTTSTWGLDVILSNRSPLGRGHLTTSFAANLNNLKIDKINTAPKLAGKEDTYFDMREQYFLKASAPPSKLNLTLDYQISKSTFLVRFVRFGEIELANWNYDENDLDIYKAKITTDVSYSLKASQNVLLTVGANNVFNVYPDRHSASLTETGGAWDPVQMGPNGGFGYVKLKLSF